MIFDQVEQLYTVVNTNFATDLGALATAKGVTINTGATFVKRQNADVFFALGVTLPACGIYVTRASTKAKQQGIRDTTGTAVFDYYAEDADPVKVAKQAELAAEALLMSVDRMATAGAGVFGAAELEDSITVEMSDGFEKRASEGRYWRRAVVRFAIYDRDTGL